jgi:hypothetical protein
VGCREARLGKGKPQFRALRPLHAQCLLGRCMSECDFPASDSLLWLSKHLPTFLNGSADVADRRNNTMTVRYMVGTKTDGKTSSVTVLWSILLTFQKN